MTVYSTIMAVTWLVAGVGALVIGKKSGEGTLPMNNLAGMRTVEAMASEEAWVAGHKAAAGMLKLSSIPFLIGGVACLVVGDSWISWISAPVVILSISIILVASSKAKAAVLAQG